MSAGMFGMDLERIFAWTPRARRDWDPGDVSQMIRALQGNGLDIVASMIRALAARAANAERRVKLLEPRASIDKPADPGFIRALCLCLDGSIIWRTTRLDCRAFEELVPESLDVEPIEQEPTMFTRTKRTFIWRSRFGSLTKPEFDVFEESNR